MTELSYAMARKIKVIEGKLGSDWRKARPDVSIDAVYNECIGDTRKNLFCKVTPDIKRKLDEMCVFSDVKMSEFIEMLIDSAFDAYAEKKDRITREVAKDFSGA